MRDGWVALATAALAAGSLSLIAFQGWGPQDAGTAGNAALWVLEGQVPHVDFHDVYPGLQGIVHSAFFAILGVSIRSLQISWLLVAAGSAAAIYLVLRELDVSRVLAGVAAFGSVVLAFLMYPIAMPSWWNVMLGAISVVLLLKWHRSGRLALLWASGLLVGISAMMKSTGVLIAIPAFLWLMSWDEDRPRWSMGVGTILGMALMGLGALGSLSLPRMVLVWIPVFFVLGAIYSGRGPVRPRTETRGLWKAPWMVFALAVLALPLAVVVGYAAIGELSALIDGWVVGPSMRFSMGQRDIPFSLVALLVLGTLALTFGITSRRVTRGTATAGVVLLVGAWVALDWTSLPVYLVALVVWIPLVLAGSLLVRGSYNNQHPEALLVVAIAIIFGIVQVPLWFSAYAAYTMPLLITAVVAVLGRSRLPFVVGIALVGLVLLIQSVRGFMYLDVPLTERITWIELESTRAGIVVPEEHDYYNEALAVIRPISEGSSLYASPDVPELAFLAGVESANRTLWESLHPSWDPDEMVDHAAAGGPVVIHHEPAFSDPLPADDVETIRQLLPESTLIENFEIRWREDDGSG